MSRKWTIAAVRIGMPTVDTVNACTTVRVTATSIIRLEDVPSPKGQRVCVFGDGDAALRATVVLTSGDDLALPNGRPEAQDVKDLVARAMDRAFAEARAAAEAFVQVIAPEPPDPPLT